MRAARLTSRPTMSSPRARGQPQCMPMRTHIGRSPSDSFSNALLQRERAWRSPTLGVVEPQQQPVAELLHDARAVGQRAAHEHLLPFEQRERDVVAVLVGQLREADDVGEDDGPRDASSPACDRDRPTYGRGA